MNKLSKKYCLRTLFSIGTILILFNTSPALADLQLMPANIEIVGTVESIDSIKAVVKVQGRSYRFAKKMSLHKADGTIVKRPNIRLKKGMKIAIRHSAPTGNKTYIAEEIWVRQ